MQYLQGSWEKLVNALLDNCDIVDDAKTYVISEKRSVFIGYFLDETIPKCIRKSRKTCIFTMHWIDPEGELKIDYRHVMTGKEVMNSIKTQLPIGTSCFSIQIEWEGKKYHFIFLYWKRRP